MICKNLRLGDHLELDLWDDFCLGLIFICEYWHYLKHGYSFIEQMIETMSLSYLGHNDDSIQMDKDGLGLRGLIFRSFKFWFDWWILKSAVFF